MTLNKRQMERLAYRFRDMTFSERRKMIRDLSKRLKVFRTVSEHGIIDGNTFYLPIYEEETSFKPTPDELLLLAYLGLKTRTAKPRDCKKLLDFNDSKFSRVMRGIKSKGYLIDGYMIPYYLSSKKTWRVMFDEFILDMNVSSQTKVLYAFINSITVEVTTVTNEFITEKTGMKPTAITKHFNILEEKGYIKKKRVTVDGRVKREITIL